MTFVRSIRGFACFAIASFGVTGMAGAGDGKEAPAPAAPLGTPPPASEVELTTWEGFLWVSAEGWTRMGIPLVSEQFMEGGPQVLDAPLSNRMRSIEGAIPSFVKEPAFWYASELARDDWEPQRRSEPRILVKVRGQARSTIVHLSVDEERPVFGGELRAPSFLSPVSLRDAHLVTIERLDPKWLAAWRAMFRTEGSPWVASKSDSPSSHDTRAAFLKAAIEALGVMRAVSPSNADLLIAARKIDPDVRDSTKFRHRIENGVQRIVVAEAKSLQVTLPASMADRLLPPESDVGRWFGDAKTRAEFLARAALNWKGDPEDFDVAHYLDDGNGSQWQQHADLETIRNSWSDVRYARIRATTLTVANMDRK